jgi:predicted amidohydrolase YtcJ
MTASKLIAVLALLALAGGCAPGEEADERLAADLLLVNAAVYTLDPQRPWAEAVAIAGERIIAVGSTADITARYRGEARDLAGGMLLPGFHDAHSHPISGGMQSLQCDLADALTVEETLAMIRDCDAAKPPGPDPGDEWLLGGGWNLGLFPDANPHKRLLDEITTRPVYLRGADGHSGWANSEALRRAGISADTEDPPLGVIERDADGEPSGTLREEAQALMTRVLPPVTDDDRREGALAGLAMANAFGITSVVDASVSRAELDTYRALERDGLLTARIVGSVRMAGYGGPGDSALLEPDSRGTGLLVRADAAKIFLDGVLEGETAALLAPYIDTLGRGEGRTGLLNVPWDELQGLVADLDRRGIQVHVHAIGDRAVREALDAFAAAREANGPTDNRHHICHLQLVHPDDHPRFAELGVLANFQALWAFPDEYITDINLPAVGEERVNRMYPIGSIERAGGIIVGGSDWSVSSMNPLDAIETAVTRQDPTGRLDGVLNADEAVSLETMLAAYTINGAYLMHQARETGSIEAGKLADLVVLERNLFEVDPGEISDIGVVLTLLGGRQVYPPPEA